MNVDQAKRKSLYAINEESKHNFTKEIKQGAAKSSYAKRRSPRAERQSKKLAAAEKLEPKLPANLDSSGATKSNSEEREKKAVSAKKKLDKSNSVKVKKTSVTAETKNTCVTKFTGRTDATNSTHTNSSNSALTATVSALKEQPENTLQKRTAFGSTIVTNYEPRTSMGKAGTGEFTSV